MNDAWLKYQGYFNDTITVQITSLMESALAERNLDPALRMRVKALMIEQIQNIQRYSSRSRQGTLEIGTEDNHLYVATTNTIDTESLAGLDERLSQVSRADHRTLERMVRDSLREPLAPGEQGAGLGLLFLARQSSRRLKYRFIPQNENEITFQLKSYI